MQRDPLIPRDEAGIARRFQSHREAVRWSFGSVGRWAVERLSYSVIPVVGLVVWRILRGDFNLLASGILALVVLVFLLGSWVFASATLYFYLALSGGVVGRGERNESGRANHR